MKYSYHDQVYNIKYEGCTLLPSLEEVEQQLLDQWEITIPVGGIIVYGGYIYQKFNKTTWAVPSSYEPDTRKPCNTHVYPATCYLLEVTTPVIQAEVVTPVIQTEVVTPVTPTEIATPPVIQKKPVIQRKSVSIAEAAAAMKSQGPPPAKEKEKYNFKNIAPMVDLTNVFNKDKQQEEQEEQEVEGECKSRVLNLSLLLGT